MSIRLLPLFLILSVSGACSKAPEPAAGTAPAAAPAAATPSPAAAPAQAPGPFTDAARAAAAKIDGHTIRATVAEISADEYGGRAPASEGDVKARAWIAGELKRLGFAPGAADGSYEQPFELVGINSTQPKTWTFKGHGKDVSLTQNTDFIVASGVQAEQVAVNDAELVFVGFGITAPEYQWDDFKGMDLKGKVLVVMNNDPDWDPELFAGNRRLWYGRWDYKYISAAEQGAAGAIIIHTTPSAGYPFQVVQSSWTGEQFELPAGDEPRVQLAAWTTEDAMQRLVALAGRDLGELMESAKSREFRPVPLGITTSISFPNAIRRAQSANVLGLLRGSDPRLADEVVVYSAHHDHLGIGEPNPNGDPEDRIYNGARDNASGVGMLLSVAEAFAALPEPPRRSILLAFVGAEEQGLIGSEYYARFPTFAPGRIAANINVDSGNIWGRTRDITFIGYGKSTLDAVADQVAAMQGRTVKPDQEPDKGYFYRSDQFNFARIGVPALYVENGYDFLGHEAGWGHEQIGAYTEKNYHQPSDELTDDWNLEGMAEDTQFAFWAGYIVAEDEKMPAWNPGDEFEAARKAALAQ